MRTIRTITRFVARWGWQYAPHAQSVEVHLIEGCNGDFFIRSPWACVNAHGGLDTTDGQLAAILGPHAFVTEAEAQSHADRQAPHWAAPHNQVVNGRIHDAIRWDGELVGVGKLADNLGVTRERLYAIGRGEVKASRWQALAAQEYRGRPV